MYLYAITIFLSAFLLFQVQPMIGKCILPWFGSSSSVWTTCMLLFQVLLLAGYAYAHLLRRFLSPRRQAITHGVLLVAALATLPIAPHEPAELASENPTWQIMGVLLLAVGATYTLLSSTGPLMQAWFSLSHPGQSPYRLYALSNVGSLLALVSYPLGFERYFTLVWQRGLWSAGFALFALLALVCAARLASLAKERNLTGQPPGVVTGSAAGDYHPKWLEMVVWLLLASCGSVMLLAITNVICQDSVSVPMLWVAPLAVYLLTFILAFDSPWWYQPVVFTPLLLISGAFMSWALWEGVDAPLWAQLAIYMSGVFFTCMSCHGELARHKPSPEHLTLFFLVVSLGGALGGAFVALGAPRFFNGYWELHGGLAATLYLVLLVGLRRSWLVARRQAAGAPGAATNEKSAVPARSGVWSWLQSVGYTGAFIGAAFVAVGLYEVATKDKHEVLEQERSYYGVLSIEERSKGETLPDGTNSDEWYQKSLMHGRIMHGFQYQANEKRTWPTSYYSRQSGLGLALEHHPERQTPGRQFRVGVVGLGTGTAAVYLNAGDALGLYEINPHMVEFSNRHFSHVKDAETRGAKIDLFLGDARLVMRRQLERDQAQHFDVLAIDAFSGDAIPMHLLTLECFRTYFDHLDPDGVLAVHVSNRFLDLEPVVRQLAEDLEKEALIVDFDEDDEIEYPGSVSSCTWVLVTTNQDFIQVVKAASAYRAWTDEDPPGVRWTDDFSSLLPILRWQWELPPPPWKWRIFGGKAI